MSGKTYSGGRGANYMFRYEFSVLAIYVDLEEWV